MKHKFRNHTTVTIVGHFRKCFQKVKEGHVLTNSNHNNFLKLTVLTCARQQITSGQWTVLTWQNPHCFPTCPTTALGCVSNLSERLHCFGKVTTKNMWHTKKVGQLLEMDLALGVAWATNSTDQITSQNIKCFRKGSQDIWFRKLGACPKSRSSFRKLDLTLVAQILESWEGCFNDWI